MKLEVGMYVRTKVGKIAKIINKYDNSGSLHNENFVWVLDDSSVLALHSQKVVKASHSLIDLIEVGDYVNGELVVQVSDDKDWVFTEPVYFDEYRGEERHYCYNNSEIKSIVTKDQFESVKYEVKNEKNMGKSK